MTPVHRSLTGLHIKRGLFAGLILLVGTVGTEAGAQNAGVPNAMQGFAQNRDQPIKIEAASLEMIDKKKQATFTGDVTVVQGDTTMKSDILVAFYDSADSTRSAGSAAPAAPAKAPIKSATPGPGGGSSSIRRLEAKGKVIVTQNDQVVTGETAIFDTTSNLITMKGGVVLTQCGNVMRGDRLAVDMTTGVSRLESKNGKVQALLAQSGQGCASPVPAPNPRPG